MTIRIQRVVRLLTPCSLLLTIVGCTQQATESATGQPTELPKVVIVPSEGDPQPQPPVPQPQPEQAPPPAPVFAFASDLGGKALPRVVAPDVSRPLPAERLGAAPRPRTIPVKVLDPDALTQASYVPPPLASAKATAAKPTNPPEKLPLDLGAGAGEPPAKPVLPVAAVDTPRARDVNLPPPAPALGRPTSDRVPFDDPTSDFGNAAVVGSAARVSLAPSSFMKAVVPDPFEYGAEVKPKVPLAAEPSAAPVTVNPQRVK